MLAAPQARAGQMDKLTMVTIDQPVEIPGMVLAAGTYEFKVAGWDMPDVVQIFNRDGTQLMTTLMTIPANRPAPADHSIIEVGARTAGAPKALEKWFYPGESNGREFCYPKTSAPAER
jgi:hypothetical protein